ncbi:protein-L-isoaspartate O-methyltransferase [Candidatus Bathyarchaeota archaeon]|nr:MAG: protein-L-isoaspartate O-methyltransferase [Candidatus Bathyarchaeota archaeon]
MDFEAERRELVNRLVASGFLKSEKVIQAMLKVPREEFLPEKIKSKAYVDSPLPVSHGQTISAPHMVAMMCEFLELEVGDKVLEVGAGTGYHAAVIAEIVAPKNVENPGHVFTIEIIKELVEFAKRNLEKTLYSDRVTIVWGDGTLGLPEHAPFNKILLTAAAPSIPKPLIQQLAPNGVLLAPVGQPYFYQTLKKLRKTQEGKIEVSELGGVAFVPLRGKYGWKD